jgi:hypothetical protein
VRKYYFFTSDSIAIFARFTRVLKWPTRAKKDPIYTQTRQINYFQTPVEKIMCAIRRKSIFSIHPMPTSNTKKKLHFLTYCTNSYYL